MKVAIRNTINMWNAFIRIFIHLVDLIFVILFLESFDIIGNYSASTD